MKLALVESKILWEDKQGNYEKLAGVLEKLSTLGRLPELIALPEMSFTGFSMNTTLTAESAEENGRYATIERMKELALHYEVAIAFGWVKRLSKKADALSENHYTVVDKAANVLLDYAKIHPFSYSGEDKYFVGGDKVCTCTLEDFRLGAAICYDLRFPEVFQAMSDSAELILLPANWPEKRREHFTLLSKARAIENQCYIAAVNCRGEMGGLSYSGDTMLIDPYGNVVEPEKVISVSDNHVMLYSLANDLSRFRGEFPTIKDRKTELYINILRKS